MAQYGVDGAFLHKPIIGTSRIPKEVGCNVEKAAGKTGRVFAITSVTSSFFLLDLLNWSIGALCRYDVSGVQRKQSEIQNIVPDCELFRSSSYLREKGQPVVALSGKTIFSPPLMMANTNPEFLFARFRIWSFRP